MTQTTFMIVAAALLLAAVMIPVPSGTRGLLFVILIAVGLLVAIGAGLNDVTGWFR